jgi:aspartyl-tRNA(Asn)/glutamyl-tRNA(Gln) amidotransferase subunit A
MSDDLYMLSATDLVEGFRTRRFSPVEVTRAVLSRIEALNGTYNAFCVIDAEGALAHARASEDRWMRAQPLGPVDGVPTTVKDLILAKGWPTLRGSRTIDPKQDWDVDGSPVARMRECGAVLLGKTTTPEFGWKGVTDSPLTGVTVNPWNTALTPGGSSGGAAVAAALGMGALHIATDGGGSIRMPAGFCGLFGFKPTFGLVPIHPHSPAGTLWHQGPIARTVADACLLIEVIARPDPRDWYAVAHGNLRPAMAEEAVLDGMRIALSRTLGYARVDPEIDALVADAAAWFADQGAIVEEVDTVFDDPLGIMVSLWSVALGMVVENMQESRQALLDPPILEIAAGAASLSATDYRRTEQAREALGRRMQLFHENYDLLITPQLPLTAFEAGREVPANSGMTRWWEWSPFTYPFNLTQQPAATVPCGFASNGMPVALQMVASKFADAKVLRACRAYERAHPFRMPSQTQEHASQFAGTG